MKRLGMMMVLLAWLCVAKATVVNEIDYKLNIAKGVAEVNDILSSKESLTIPDTLEYYGYKFAIKRINGITSSKVKELRLPNTLRDTIRYGMLTNKYLEKVYCPPHITKMDSAFMDCTALQEVELPNMLESADYLFQGCKSLKTCSIPIGVRKMTYTFYNCTSLKTIILHDYIKTISAYTFGLCTSLEDLTLPGKLETIEGGFEKTAIKRLDIPNSVKKISANAFKNSNIENVNIPLNLEVENFENSNFLLSIENLKEVRIDENDNKFKLIEGSVYFQKEDAAELWFSQTEGVFKLPTYKKISVNALALKKYLSELIVPKECEEFYLVGGNFKILGDGEKFLRKLTIEESDKTLAMHVKNSSYDAFIDEFYLGRPVTPLNGEKKCIATISDTFHNTKYTGMTLRLGKYASNIDLDILYQSYYYLYGTVVNYVCIHKGYGPNVLEFDNGVEEIIPNFRLNFVDEMPDKYMYTAEKVDTVRCYGMVPPECKNLNNLTSIDAKLYVPKGAWPAYATHPFWSMFTDINEMENESGIEDVKMQEESKNAVEVERYDVNGRVLAKPISGLNIVKMSNGKVKKVWVK